MAQELTRGVWLLELGFPVFGANAFLVDDGEVTLVDAGLPWFGVRRELRDAGYEVADIDRVLVTHYDIDHVGGLRNLSNLDAPVFVGQRDADLLSGTYDPPLFHHKGAFHRLARVLVPIPERFEILPLEDGAEIGGFTAYHTPGHNPGHTVYVHDDLGVGLVGDLVWERDGALTPPEWWDSYDTHEIRRSIRRFAGLVPTIDVLCMGHGTPIPRGGSDALSNLVRRL
ncbi:Glyoxylase, beta-lactamase superfamily II [Haladaptatus litoreus]|uniref:Glyoxylase, beta-lactamase superfamily II n=1 Tax=Haladaptatus litoreus TaxID=553468 RepID=A0A1N7E078_9EURY|nr:MBL fold metallo-hydrolase [Haladaptatus litoreus]SIR81532.1 Glyoxylase, beta-lactamase superfamily II [Haladaptatus litoreus]